MKVNIPMKDDKIQLVAVTALQDAVTILRECYLCRSKGRAEDCDSCTIHDKPIQKSSRPALARWLAGEAIRRAKVEVA